MERQFQSFLEYVPFEGNECTYSYKLLNLILSIGGHVDSAFKEMARYPGFATEEKYKKILKILEENRLRAPSRKPPMPVPIRLCLEAFETEYQLSSRYVTFKGRPTTRNISPFISWGHRRVPEWWETYNGLKHDAGVNLKKANLRVTLNALAGAFLLNVRHIPAMIELYRSGLLKVAWTDKHPAKRVRDQLNEPQFLMMIRDKQRLRGIGFLMETPVFLFLYDGGSAYE